ncbi:MAG: proton-conducting transporter membrane subunit [Allobranchiibius sp.]
MNPDFNFLTLAPVLIPALGTILVLLLDTAFPRLGRAHWLIAALLLLGGAATTAPILLDSAHRPRSTLCTGGSCWYAVDHLGAGLQLLALVSSLTVVLLAYPIRVVDERVPIQVALVLTSTAGAVGVAGAHDLASLLITLEISTLPLIALVVLRARHSAVDAGLNLLTTSLVSFAILAMGAGLWFAATGTARLDVRPALVAGNQPDLRRILVLAVVFIVAGLAFKLSLAPFHLWTAPTIGAASLPVGTLLATTSKVAAVAGLVALLRTVTDLSSASIASIGVLAVLSMTVGNIMALRERNALRFLGWSTVAQSGWIVLPFTTVSTDSGRRSAQYLAIYVLASLVAFAVVTAIAHAQGRQHVTRITSYAGLLRRRPFLGGALALALLTFAGLPPAIAGLAAKVVALQSIIGDRLWVLAVLAALNAMLGVAVYLRWIAIMLAPVRQADAAEPGMSGEHDHELAGAPDMDPVHPAHIGVVVVSTVALVVCSVLPQAAFALFN